MSFENKTRTSATVRLSSANVLSADLLMTPASPNATSDPGFFDGRFMVEVVEWNWAVYVGLSNTGTPVKYRFQRGLMYSRTIEITGRVRAPSVHRGKLIQIWISPFGREVRFNARTGEVGQFYSQRLGPQGPDFEVNLELPEEALAPALTCLSSVWKFVDIWTAEKQGEPAKVTAFCFSASIHPNLIDWAGAEAAPS